MKDLMKSTDTIDLAGFLFFYKTKSSIIETTVILVKGINYY
jgi:hypothetical protein